MTEQQKHHIQQLAQELLRYSFPKIKAQADSEGKHLAVYYLQLVEDFFAVADCALTHEDMQAYDRKASILDAIWSGGCEICFGSYLPVEVNASDWLNNQSALYKETFLLAQEAGDDDKAYEALRKDFEECLLNALAQCDAEGLFDNREENGLLLFAFYVDDYDENGEGSLLYRSTERFNSEKDWQKLK